MKEKPIAPHSLIFQLIERKLIWLEVEQQEKELAILNAGVQVFDETDEENNPDDQSKFKAALEKIKPEIKLGLFTRYEVIFIAPSHRLTARYLETPPTDEESLNELLEFEVAEALQIDIEDIAWDTVFSSQHGQSEIKHLLWMATRKDFIQALLEEWPQDLFTPNQITTDIDSVYEYLLFVHPDQIIKSSLLIIREGGRAILAVANSIAIYYYRSVNINKANGPDPIKILSAEIKRTLSYASEKTPEGQIENLIFIGFDEWALESIEQQAFEQSFSATRITLEDLQTEFSVESGLLHPEHVPLLSVALQRHQLQQRGVNLLKQKPKDSNWKAWVPETAIPMKQFGTYAGMMIGAFIILWIGQIVWLNYAAADRSQSGQELLKLADKLKQEETALQTYVRTDVHYADVLFVLSEILPEDMLVKNITLDDKNGIDLALTGGNQDQVLEVIENMNRNKHFRDITLDRAANENDGFTMYLKGTLIPG